MHNFPASSPYLRGMKNKRRITSLTDLGMTVEKTIPEVSKPLSFFTYVLCLATILLSALSVLFIIE